jgi:hypothetical protein
MAAESYSGRLRASGYAAAPARYPRDLQYTLRVGAAEEVTFVQQSAEAYQYRDAVGFQNGREILLQQLRCSQRVDV